jgi:TonB-dependent SusC/RagA subfamily outer membrane receptor
MMLLAFFAALFSVSSYAQTQFKGVVTSSKDNLPLTGVNVVNLTSNAGTQTDATGTFILPVKTGDRLRISSVGFATKELVVAQGISTVNVSLDSDDGTMESVVVVGYGTQKKVNMTGAVSMITAKDIEDRPLTNLSTALSGLMSGVSVSQGSGAPGADGASIIVRGRGTLSGTAPLIVIDGVIGALDAVNPQDVESISVLKDAASASIYGSQAGNGVILITTKKGTRNKLSVNDMGTFSTTAPMNVQR